MRALLLVLILLPSLCSIGQVPAQDISQGLELLHRARKVRKFIPIGKKIILKTEETRVIGVLTGIESDTILIDGSPYRVRDVIWIGERSFASYALASGIAILGLGMTGSGLVYLADSERSGVINSAVITAAGVGISSLSVSGFRNGRRFYLDSDWKVMLPD